MSQTDCFQLYDSRNSKTAQKLECKPFGEVSIKEGHVILKLGGNDEQKKDNSRRYEISTIREDMIECYNWSGLVYLMSLAEKKDVNNAKNEDIQDNTYRKILLNINGVRDNDDEIIIPDEAIALIIRLQAEYKIGKFDEPSKKIKEIFTYIKQGFKAKVQNIAKQGEARKMKVTEPILSNFIKDTLKTTYEAILKKSHNTIMKVNKQEFTMPKLDSDSDTLYDFLKNLVLSRYGIWSDEDKITNFVSIRRVFSQVPNYDDTFFVAWTESGNKYVTKYIGSTETGNRVRHGMLSPQTTTMILGIHASFSKKVATMGGRTQNAYRKQKGSQMKFFQQGDTSMNIHFGDAEIKGLRSSAKKYGFSSSRDLFNSNGYNTGELNVYLCIVRILNILTKWGAGTEKKSAYNNLAYEAKENSKAKEDLKQIERLFEDLSSNKKLIYEFKEKVRIGKNNNVINDILRTKNWRNKSLTNEIVEKPVDTLKGAGTTIPVTGWTLGCQIILGVHNYYEFLNDLTQFLPESGQERWYYTIVDIDKIKGVGKIVLK